MKKIKICDNHKIPRKFRKGYDFYALDYRGFKPECDGACWYSKVVYVKVVASLKGKKPTQSFDYFHIKKSLTVAP